MSKSLIEELELTNGQTVWVQINPGRVCISVENEAVNYSVWMTVTDLGELSKMIDKTLNDFKEEVSHG